MKLLVSKMIDGPKGAMKGPKVAEGNTMAHLPLGVKEFYEEKERVFGEKALIWMWFNSPIIVRSHRIVIDVMLEPGEKIPENYPKRQS